MASVEQHPKLSDHELVEIAGHGDGTPRHGADRLALLQKLQEDAALVSPSALAAFATANPATVRRPLQPPTQQPGTVPVLISGAQPEATPPTATGRMEFLMQMLKEANQAGEDEEKKKSD